MAKRWTQRNQDYLLAFGLVRAIERYREASEKQLHAAADDVTEAIHKDARTIRAAERRKGA